MEQVQASTDEADRKAVLERVAADSVFDWTYVVMNGLATVVACYGLLEDSAAVVIGAMIIAMLLGPISGVGLALVDGDHRLLGRAAASLGGGALLVVLTAVVIGLFNREIPATAEMISRTAPNMFDLMIALGGGAAGAYAVINKRLSVAFVGVAIATALVPPLATAGMFLARGQYSLSGGAFLLAFANIVGIQFACSVIFFIAGFRTFAERRMSSRATLLQNSVSIGTLLILAVLLTINLHSEVGKLLNETAVRRSLKTHLLKYPGSYLAGVRFRGDVVEATVRGPEPFSPQQVADMESSLPVPQGSKRSSLLIRYVHTTVMSTRGPRYSSEETGTDPAESGIAGEAATPLEKN